jgi:hypothetical protein
VHGREGRQSFPGRPEVPQVLAHAEVHKDRDNEVGILREINRHPLDLSFVWHETFDTAAIAATIR